MEQTEVPRSPVNKPEEGFTFLLTILELTGIVFIILMIVWITQFKGGFSWTSDPNHEFNWHPLLMTIGFVFLYANGTKLILGTYRYTTIKLKKIISF